MAEPMPMIQSLGTVIQPIGKEQQQQQQKQAFSEKTTTTSTPPTTPPPVNSDFCALTMEEIASMHFPNTKGGGDATTTTTTSIGMDDVLTSPTSTKDHPHLKRHTYHPATHVPVDALVAKKKPPERSLRHEHLQVPPLLPPEDDHPAPNSPPARTTVEPITNQSNPEILTRLMTEEEAMMQVNNKSATIDSDDVSSEEEALESDQGKEVATSTTSNEQEYEQDHDKEIMMALKKRVKALEEQLEASQANVQDMTHVNQHLTQVVQQEEVQIDVLETKAHYLTRELEHQDEQLATMTQSNNIAYYHPPTESLQAQLVVAVEHEQQASGKLRATQDELTTTRAQLQQAQDEAADMLRQCQRLSHRLQNLQHDQQEDSERDQELVHYIDELQEALAVAQQQQKSSSASPAPPEIQACHERDHNEVERLQTELRNARLAEAMVETVTEDDDDDMMMMDDSLKEHLAELEHDSQRMAVLLHNLKERDDYIARLKATIDHLHKHGTPTMADDSSLHKHLSELEHDSERMAVLLHNLKQRDDYIVKLKATLDHLHHQVAHQQQPSQQVQQLQKTIHERDGYIAKLKATIGSFKEEEERALTQFAALQESLKDLSSDQDRTDLLLQNIQQRDVYIARLKATIEHLHSEDEEAHTKVEHLQEKLKQATTEEERNALLMCHIHQRDDEAANLKQQVALLLHDDLQAHVEIATLQEQMQDHEGHAELATLQKQLKDLEHEHEKVELLTSNIKKREDYIAKLNDKLENLRHKLVSRSLRKKQPVVVKNVVSDQEAAAQIASLEHQLEDVEKDETRIATLIQNIYQRDAYIIKLKTRIDHMKRNRPPCEVVGGTMKTDDDVSTVSTMHEKLQNAYEDQERTKQKVEQLEHQLKEQKLHDSIQHERLQSVTASLTERDDTIASLRATVYDLKKEIAAVKEEDDKPSAIHHAEPELHLRCMELQKKVDDLTKEVQYYKGPVKAEEVSSPRQRSTSLGAQPPKETEMQMLRVECVHLREMVDALQRELDVLTSKVVHLDPDHRKTE